MDRPHTYSFILWIGNLDILERAIDDVRAMPSKGPKNDNTKGGFNDDDGGGDNDDWL